MNLYQNAFAAAILAIPLAGCVADSAKLNLSPCAGCDFLPVNVEPDRGTEIQSSVKQG